MLSLVVSFTLHLVFIESTHGYLLDLVAYIPLLPYALFLSYLCFPRPQDYPLFLVVRVADPKLKSTQKYKSILIVTTLYAGHSEVQFPTH